MPVAPRVAPGGKWVAMEIRVLSRWAAILIGGAVWLSAPGCVGDFGVVVCAVDGGVSGDLGGVFFGWDDGDAAGERD